MRTFLSLLILLTLQYSVQAQKVFSEGVIEYDVFTDGEETKIGTYTISLKGSMIKRHMKLNNGLENLVIHNGKEGTSATLKTVGAVPYALLMTKQEVLESNRKFAGATYKYGTTSKKMAGYDAIPCSVSYKNGMTAQLEVTKELTIDNADLLAMFPNLEGLPLSYSMDNKKSSMRFEAVSVQFKNMDSDDFAIPKNYKIVTKKELESLK